MTFRQVRCASDRLARFVPIVRTFITVTAGVGQMDRRRYLTYSGIGGILWASGVTVLGQLLGQVEFVAKNVEVILLAIVFASVVPLVVEWLRHRSSSAKPSDGQQSDDQQSDGRQSGGRPSGGRPARHATDAGGPFTSPRGVPAVTDRSEG
jgi:hypothetical protein